MSERADLVAALRAETAEPCTHKGGMGTRIRRMQALIAMTLPDVDFLDEVQLRAVLNRKCEEASQNAFASANGFPPSVISEVLNGRRPMPESVANALGYLRLNPTFRKIATRRNA